MSSYVCGYAAALPPERVEVCGSQPAGAGSDGPKGCCVSLQRGLQGHASFGTARQEA
jgi:hypothetical protein